MVKMNRKIRMKHEVKTKGTVIKKGEIVTLVDFPIYAYDRHYSDYCTVKQEGYGLVSVPKSAIHKSVKNEIFRKYYKWKE